MVTLRRLSLLLLTLAASSLLISPVSCQGMPVEPQAPPSRATLSVPAPRATAQPINGEDATRLRVEPTNTAPPTQPVTATPPFGPVSSSSSPPVSPVAPTVTPYATPPNDQVANAETPLQPPPLVQLPTPLYFLSPARSDPASRNVWLLVPGATAALPLLPDEYWVTAFDVSAAAGQVAFGTQWGQLYTLALGEEPVLRVDASLYSPEPVTVEDVAWSPDGGRLAFTLSSLNGVPEHQDGLFWIDLASGDVTKLVENYHLLPGQTDVRQVRSAARPFWSPDGDALAFSMQHWEWSEIVWIEPVGGELVNEFITPPGDDIWVTGVWTEDGAALILSNIDRGFESDLALASRDGSGIAPLVLGEELAMRFTSPAELPDGIAFLGYQWDDTRHGRLYLGQLEDQAFTYHAIGPVDNLCAPGYTRHVFWHRNRELAVLSCEQGAFLISADGTNAVNLAPYLGPIARHDFLQAFWGN